MAGLCYDEFAAGRVFRHEIRKTVLEYENALFSSLSGNPAPMEHVFDQDDEIVCRTSRTALMLKRKP